MGGSIGANNLKKCMKLNWNFQTGGKVFEKNPFCGEVWMFCGTILLFSGTEIVLNFKSKE